MSASELAKYIGRELALVDSRTGQVYYATVADARSQWGKLQVRLSESTRWFEPTVRELGGVA